MKVVGNLFKKQAFLTVILVLSIVAVTMYSSYALYFKVDPIEIAKAQTTQNLRVVYGNNGYDQEVSEKDLSSYSDEEAVKSKDLHQYKIIITNNSNHNVRPKIYLKSLVQEDSIYPEKINPSDFIDLKYIKYQINDQEILVLGNQIDKQTISTNIKIASEETVELNIKIWADKAIGKNLKNKEIHLRFVVEEISQNIYGEEKSIVNVLLYKEGGIVNIEKKIKPDYSIIDTDTDSAGLYVTEDNFGSSYYYRGIVTNNNIVFGTDTSDEDLFWKIVRVNGDGSVRLILNEKSLIGFDDLNSTYGMDKSNKLFLGYMHGLPVSAEEGIIHDNTNSSNANNKLDDWFITNLAEKYNSYLVDQVFCNDRSIVSGSELFRESTNFGAYNRLDHTSNKFIPSLKCEIKADCFTKSDQIGNGALRNSIGLLSADEAVFAGATSNIGNSLFYLTTKNNFWLMSPSSYENGAYNYALSSEKGLIPELVTETNYLRPVVNIKGDLIIKSGDGSIDNPYIIDLEQSNVG